MRTINLATIRISVFLCLLWLTPTFQFSTFLLSQYGQSLPVPVAQQSTLKNNIPLKEFPAEVGFYRAPLPKHQREFLDGNSHTGLKGQAGELYKLLERAQTLGLLINFAYPSRFYDTRPITDESDVDNLFTSENDRRDAMFDDTEDESDLIPLANGQSETERPDKYHGFNLEQYPDFTGGSTPAELRSWREAIGKMLSRLTALAHSVSLSPVLRPDIIPTRFKSPLPPQGNLKLYFHSADKPEGQINDKLSPGVGAGVFKRYSLNVGETEHTVPLGQIAIRTRGDKNTRLEGYLISKPLLPLADKNTRLQGYLISKPLLPLADKNTRLQGYWISKPLLPFADQKDSKEWRRKMYLDSIPFHSKTNDD